MLFRSVFGKLAVEVSLCKWPKGTHNTHAYYDNSWKDAGEIVCRLLDYELLVCKGTMQNPPDF